MDSRKKGIWLVFFGVLLMSFESPIISFTNVSGFKFILYLGLFLFLSTALILPFSKKKIREIYTQNPKILILASVFMALSNIFFINAVKYAGIATTVLIIAIGPIFCAMIGYLFLRQKTPKIIFLATALVFLGLYIILADSQKNIDFLGVMLGFLCVLSFSIVFVILSNFASVDRIANINLAGLFTVIFALFFTNFDIDWHNFFIIFAMGFFITPLSRIFIGYGSLYILPAEVGILMILESVLAPFWGYLFLNEAISANTLIGGSIIVLSVGFYTAFTSK